MKGKYKNKFCKCSEIIKIFSYYIVYLYGNLFGGLILKYCFLIYES